LSREQRDLARTRGYIANAHMPAPSVIFLNSTLASLAVAEFMNLVTGFKPPHPLVRHDLLKQTTTVVKAQRRADCTSCSIDGLLGWGDLESLPDYEPIAVAGAHPEPQSVKEDAPGRGVAPAASPSSILEPDAGQRPMKPRKETSDGYV
jgi:hypothetical protein